MIAPQRSIDGAACTIKFLCSYGGRILPRPSDGRLRYVGGQTRVLSVDRFISFSELMVKLGELCGYSVTLRCQLPSEDMDVLVSVKSDEDLANMMAEYHRASLAAGKELKVRAILSPPKSLKQISSPPLSSSASSADLSPTNSTKSDHPPRIFRCSSAPSNSFARPVLAFIVGSGTPRCIKYDIACHRHCHLEANYGHCNLISHPDYRR